MWINSVSSKSKKDEKEIDINIEFKNIESRYVEIRVLITTVFLLFSFS
jgi:hypothetical protein